MEINLNQVITNGAILSDRFILRDGFAFTAVTNPANIYDGIILKYPYEVRCSCPVITGSKRSLDEQIDFINQNKIEKALVIAENIDFILRCPTLKYLEIIPADGSGNDFDYSPLYSMPKIKSLGCRTEYGKFFEFTSTIDYSKVNGLESIHAGGTQYKNYEKIETLKSLGLSDYKKSNLTEAFCSEVLDTLTVIQCKIKSLEGLQKSKKMQCLYLYHNRSLQDISMLRQVKSTLKTLRIDCCPKITDFSVLAELENLEMLELSGGNVLPSLEFMKRLKNLKTFVFNMNVMDGDLSPCLRLSFAQSRKNRKHYNLKDSDLPKGRYVHGNESIEVWRRID